jgi:hypothetical protein
MTKLQQLKLGKGACGFALVIEAASSEACGGDTADSAAKRPKK